METRASRVQRMSRRYPLKTLHSRWPWVMSDRELIVLFVTFGCVSNCRERTNHMKPVNVRIICMALTFLILRYPHPFLVGMS